ncbi:efflux transporter, RND family, MFP subunit [Rhodomicrobium vannielii ATCC 17100]|uniref:Efflux transporter, RND family, MFP subunit n=1 Tax=Rhodomicrobium vannielii (strain ATCC 17100 / DSM 162 / LMG 4299 / NCIMB 10020 / ATH 3.1.1) TaxID=648757 RepID=E3HZP3_RHOVT|nr:efflux RND transporter periplasmic adaptor subunit [Rhodomicrobium vannielii]ADP72153.1 efflux transporter, RND family, MFP subunit [Rhodomicrobium vannielii ATCC 17100]
MNEYRSDEFGTVARDNARNDQSRDAGSPDGSYAETFEAEQMDRGAPKTHWGRRVALAIACLIVVGGLGVIVNAGFDRHAASEATARQELVGRQNRVPALRIEKVKAVETPKEVRLPATTQAFESATLFARQSGYIDKRFVDIGSRVKSGELLALISAPEVDDQLNQARAQLKQMVATLEQVTAQRDLASVTNQRNAPLVREGWQTKQSGDQTRLNLAAQNAAVNVANANIEAQKAQISRLERMQSYERVTAPFDGVITQRSIDTGSLVTADTSSGSPLFSIVRDNVLRVQVHVPQDVALQLKPGMEATLDVPELPGQRFAGEVARTAIALDANSRTLLVEADIKNADYKLSPGLYGTVRFNVPRPVPIMMIPSSALIFDQHGMRVATNADGVARLHQVTLGDDEGAQVQIIGGLEPGQDLIVNPPAGIENGAKVAVAAPAHPVQEAAASPASLPASGSDATGVGMVSPPAPKGMEADKVSAENAMRAEVEPEAKPGAASGSRTSRRGDNKAHPSR